MQLTQLMICDVQYTALALGTTAAEVSGWEIASAGGMRPAIASTRTTASG